MSKKLKPKNLFGKKINFNAEYLGRDFYNTSSLENLELIDKLCFSNDLAKVKSGLENYIKIYLIRSKGVGIIIGQTTKKEGYYYAKYEGYDIDGCYESEPASLEIKKAFHSGKLQLDLIKLFLFLKVVSIVKLKGWTFNE